MAETKKGKKVKNNDTVSVEEKDTKKKSVPKKETKNETTTKVTKKEENKEVKEVVEEVKKPSKKKKSFRKKLYLDFNVRFIANAVILLLCVVGLVSSIFMAFRVTKNEIIQYRENSNVDYKVYLKKNDFYEKPFLNKDMVYVASLIDKIAINFDYNFKVNEKSDIDFKYNIVAKLLITSQNNSKVFYEKDYTLVEEVTKDMISEKEFNINEDVTIDYSFYNNLANQFKSNYAVSTISYLDVCLQVVERSKESNFYELRNSNRTVLSIPISEQEVNINLDNKKVNDEKQIVSKARLIVRDQRYLFVGGVFLLLICIFVIRIIRKASAMTTKVSHYDRYINRLLRSYDRIIVNVKTPPRLEDYNVIKVESFEELIDVRDNTKEPIKYFVITEHQKSEFFVTNNNDLYLYVVKEIDLKHKK